MPALDAAYFRQQAVKCRHLARHSPEREARILQEMANEYEADAREMNKPL